MALSGQSRQLLVVRYRDEKRFNGSCVGPLLCVDNLGRHFSPDSLRVQLQGRLTGVVDIRFARADFAETTVLLGWCCIEFESTEAAAIALCEVDHLYLRTEGSPSILRPLLPHFPDRPEPLDLPLRMSDLGQSDSSVMALHLGQSDTVNRESREFIRLDQVLQQTKFAILEKTKQQLLFVLSDAGNSATPMHQDNPLPKENESPGVLLLKNVPESVSEQMLLTFMDCFDPEVVLYKIRDPVSLQSSPHVIVTVSTVQKAKLLCEDIQKHLLISEGFRPITASLFDPDDHSGFGSVLDEALRETGVLSDDGVRARELVVVRAPVLEHEKQAVRIRAVMETMQHSRSYYKKLKHEQQKALHDHIVSDTEKIHERFTELSSLLSMAGQLQ